MRREYTVAFRKVVETALKLRDEIKMNNSLLDNAVQELHNLEKQVEAEQAKTKKLLAALDERKALTKKAPQVGFALLYREWCSDKGGPCLTCLSCLSCLSCLTCSLARVATVQRAFPAMQS